jgi:hypothetical protein
MDEYGILLTYRPPIPGDGSGAQAQRILSIYSAAKANRIGYRHTPILDLGANAGDSFSSTSERKEFLTLLNALILLPSDTNFERVFVVQIHKIPFYLYSKLRYFNKALKYFRCSLIIQIQQVYNYIDSNPGNYENVMHFVRPRFTLSESPEETLTIDCHIRRSTNPQFSRDGSINPRYTPTSWFRNIVKEVRMALPSEIKLSIRIHTDGIPTQELWTPPREIADGTIEYWQSLGVLNISGDLILTSEDFPSQFQEFGNVEVIQDIDPIKAWEMMASSDVLLMGKSSMSYIAGLIRGWRPVIYAKFWHAGLTSWLEVEQELELSSTTKEELKEIVQTLVKEKSFD